MTPQDSDRRRTPREGGPAPGLDGKGRCRRPPGTAGPAPSLGEADRQDLDRIKRGIERCREAERASTLAMLELGRLLLDVEARELWRLDGAAGMGAWLRVHYKINKEQARRYRRIGRELTDDEVLGYVLSLNALVMLCRAPRGGRRALLQRLGGPLVIEAEIRAALPKEAGQAHLQVRGGPLGRLLKRQLELVAGLEVEAAGGALALGPEDLCRLERQAAEALGRIQALRLRTLAPAAAGPGAAAAAAGPGAAAAPGSQGQHAPGPGGSAAASAPAAPQGPPAAGPGLAGDEDPARPVARVEPAEIDPQDAELEALMDPVDPEPRPRRQAAPAAAPALAPPRRHWSAGMGGFYDTLAALPGALSLLDEEDDGAPVPVPVPGAPPPPPAADDGVEYTPLPVPATPLSCALPPGFDDPAAPYPILRTAAIAGGTAGFSDFGLLGLRYKSWEPLGLSYAAPFALGFFGVPGSGKTYGLGAVLEGALQPLRAINNLKQPLCVLAFHYHPSASYEPELLAGVRPNGDVTAARVLTEVYRALPEGLRDVLVLTLPEKVKEMRARHPHSQVHGIRFALRELGTDGLRTLLGLDLDHAPHYAQQVEGLLREMDGPLTWNGLLRAVRAAPFDKTSRRLLIERLRRVRPWIDDRGCLRDFLRPGRLVQVDLRAEWLPRELAMTLFSLCLRVLALHRSEPAAPGGQGGAGEGLGAGPLLVAFDEAHKFMKSRPLLQMIETLVRERRHLLTSVLLCSQDPVSVPADLLSLLDGIGLFRHESQAWNRHLGRACAAFRKLPVEATARLKPGLMWFWSRRWQVVDPAWPVPEERPILIATRPRLSQHGAGDGDGGELAGG